MILPVIAIDLIVKSELVSPSTTVYQSVLLIATEAQEGISSVPSLPSLAFVLNVTTTAASAVTYSLKTTLK